MLGYEMDLFIVLGLYSGDSSSWKEAYLRRSLKASFYSSGTESHSSFITLRDSVRFYCKAFPYKIMSLFSSGSIFLSDYDKADWSSGTLLVLPFSLLNETVVGTLNPSS